MNTSFQFRILSVSGMLLVALLCNGCVVPGDRYASGSVSYGVGFYEPYGYDYGGWGSGYLVGPPHSNYRHFEARHISPSRPSYRPAPASNHVPSIPTHHRPSRLRRH